MCSSCCSTFTQPDTRIVQHLAVSTATTSFFVSSRSVTNWMVLSKSCTHVVEYACNMVAYALYSWRKYVWQATRRLTGRPAFHCACVHAIARHSVCAPCGMCRLAREITAHSWACVCVCLCACVRAFQSGIRHSEWVLRLPILNLRLCNLLLKAMCMCARVQTALLTEAIFIIFKWLISRAHIHTHTAIWHLFLNRNVPVNIVCLLLSIIWTASFAQAKINTTPFTYLFTSLTQRLNTHRSFESSYSTTHFA